MQMLRTMLIALPILVLLPVAAHADEKRPRFAETPSIEVIGHAEETRVPDEIVVRISATSSAATSDDALKSLTRTTRKLIDVIKEAGLPDTDTESSGPDTEVLYKHFYDQGGNELYAQRQPNGYRARFALTIKSKSFDIVGALLPKITAADGLVDSVAFSVSDERQLRVTLEDRAILDAVARAKRQIQAANGKPGRILEIGNPEPIDYGNADLGRPFHSEPYSRDFAFALRPGKSTISVERRILMEILPN